MDVNQGKTFDQCSEEEQVQVLTDVASELQASGQKIDLRMWKRCLAIEVARKYHIKWEAVHAFLSALAPEGLESIRCTFDKNRRPSKRRRSVASGGERSTSTAPKLMQRALERYVGALSLLAPQERTRKNLARVLGVDRFQIDSFAYQHPDFAKLLADGDRVPRGLSSSAR